MPKRTKKYEESLIESLKDPAEAAAYLNAHLGEEDGEALFLLALRDVARANGVAEMRSSPRERREGQFQSLADPERILP